MAKTLDWQEMNKMSARLLQERTGEDVNTWNQRVQAEGFSDEKALRAWLTEQGVTGYAQTLLVMERFGYPAFLLASADELIEGQYGDRADLRPIFEAIAPRPRTSPTSLSRPAKPTSPSSPPAAPLPASNPLRGNG